MISLIFNYLGVRGSDIYMNDTSGCTTPKEWQERMAGRPCDELPCNTPLNEDQVLPNAPLNDQAL